MAATGSVTGNVAATVALTTVKSTGLPSGVSARSPMSLSKTLTYTNGAAALMVDQVWASGARAISASSTDTLDVAGSLTDEFGNTITFARIKMLWVNNIGTVNIKIGVAGTLGLTTMFPTVSSAIVVPAGGFLLLAAADATGFAVTAGSVDNLVVTNLSGSVAASYDICLAGSTT